MRWSRCSLLLFVLGVLAPLVWAGAQEDFAAWRDLPTAKQEKLATFVREWRSLDPETRSRLRRVLVRYSDWLSRLTPEEAGSIERLPTVAEKIKRIRQLREKQWIARLPKADRDKVEAAKPETERQKQVAELRAKERRRELTWQLALIRSEDQAQFSLEFTKLAEELKAKVRAEDRQRLGKAHKDGWPELPKTVLELAQKYKVPVPPLVESRITLWTSYPPVNNEKLSDFVEKIEDESVRERYKAGLSAQADPVQRDMTLLELTRLYWEMHPHLLKRVREMEEQRKKQRPMGK